jgi:uncharacterized protein (DUF1778 family)
VRTKDKRIEIRVDEQSVNLITRAAELVQEPVSEFMRRAAAERASEVLAQSMTTVMPADQFDALLASLDDADDAPALTALAKTPRKFVRR